jgi:hypothetical protein
LDFSVEKYNIGQKLLYKLLVPSIDKLAERDGEEERNTKA